MLPELAPEARALSSVRSISSTSAPLARQVVGDGGAGEAAADDQDVGARSASRGAGLGLPGRPATYRLRTASRLPEGDGTWQQQFRGSYTVTITPFTEDGKAIDLAAWQRFVDWQLAEGVPGIIILGTTGEFLTISDEERREFVEATVKHVAGRIPVLVGTMNAYTPNAVRYSREAEELGADGLMIVPPYYYTPTEDEIFAYYRAICEAVSIPIMLYNNPFTSNVDMSAKLVARLTRAFEQIRYIKEASQDMARVYDIIEETDGRHERVRRRADRRILSLRCGRLRQSLRQLHPARLAPHLRLHHRGPARGRQADRAA